MCRRRAGREPGAEVTTFAVYPQARRYFRGLDGLRAVGALFVLTTHVAFHSGDSLNSALNGVLSRMDSGVAIFFVISGFLLYRPHALALVGDAGPPTVRRYFLHRVLRILPALWIAVIASATLLPHDEDVTTFDYLLHGVLLQIYSSGHETNGLTQMWSLATEAAFYAALPVLAWLLGRGRASSGRLRLRLAILLSLPLLGAVWMGTANALARPLWTLWLPGYLGWFGLGMALALWQVGRQHRLLRQTPLDTLASRPGTVWGLALAVYLLVTSPLAGPYDLTAPTPGAAVFKNLAYALFGALVVLPAVAGDSDSRAPAAVQLLGRGPGRFLGNISYGVFCYHLVVLGLVESFLDYKIFSGGFAKLFVPTLLLTVLAATVSYYALERPVMRRGRRGERRRRAGASGDRQAMEIATSTRT